MDNFDVIVCGAGPSGATAANALSKAGLKVLLLEKEKLPRHKTCGGGMPMTVKDVIREIEPSAFLESEASFMKHTFNFKDPILAPINSSPTQKKISLWMVQRSIFDNALVNLAVRSGATLKDELRVCSIEEENGSYILRAKSSLGTEFCTKTKYIIGADGANGVVARLLGLRKNRVHAIAMEVEYPHKWGSGHKDLRKDVIHLEYGAIPGGYAWIFPKEEHLNVGGILFNSSFGKADKSQTRDLILNAVFKYLEFVGVPYDQDAMKFYAHPLPVWNQKESLQKKNALLVGDAAGLINPFFGDGILCAMKSGDIAAQCIASGDVTNYTKLIHKDFSQGLDAALKLAQIFYGGLGSVLYKHGIKRATATRMAAELLCHEYSFSTAVQRVTQKVTQLIPGAKSV